MKSLSILALTGLLLFTLGHASGPDDQAMAWVEYCEMHALYIETQGEYGWPDYRDIYEEECK